MAHKAIATEIVKNAATGESVTVESLWKEKAVVIVFFRRFGCMYCRIAAKELNKILPALKENNIRLIGMSFDEMGLEEFVQSNYFDGELFTCNKGLYEKLDYKRYNYLSIFPAILSSQGRQAINKGREIGVGTNFKGDGMQNGGILIVGAGGEECLLTHRQEHAAELASNDEILGALGLKSSS